MKSFGGMEFHQRVKRLDGFLALAGGEQRIPNLIVSHPLAVCLPQFDRSLA